MRNSIIDGANKDLIHCLCEFIYNTLKGNVELKDDDKTKLMKSKHYDWIKEESLTPFSADLRRFSNMLNKTLKNYNQSNNLTPRNIRNTPPAETTRSKRPISDQTYREITEVAKKKEKSKRNKRSYDPPAPASFTGHTSFKHTVEKKNKLNHWLIEQEPYTLHRPLKKFRLNQFVVVDNSYLKTAW
ncbi:unnamed protein product, partial [Brachionus calyciflorus]